jgi:hypothetical protein
VEEEERRRRRRRKREEVVERGGGGTGPSDLLNLLDLLDLLTGRTIPIWIRRNIPLTGTGNRTTILSGDVLGSLLPFI